MVKILVPVNFSDYSLNGLNYAMSLASHFDTEIVLVYCFTSVVSEENGAFFVPDSVTAAKQKLDDLRNQFLERFETGSGYELNISNRVVTGCPEDMIVTLSNQISPSVIIMGTRSQGETIKELLGSVTSDVIAKANFPVLAVPRESEPELKQVNNVLFVADFNVRDYTSLHKLVQLISSFDTKIFNVHFSSFPPPEGDLDMLQNMRNYCNSTYRNHAISCEIITGHDIVSAIDTCITNKEIDMIAITHRNRSFVYRLFHPDIIRKILFHTNIPLLVFHS